MKAEKNGIWEEKKRTDLREEEGEELMRLKVSRV